MNIEKVKELKKLYAKGSKHSNYQILSKRLSLLIGNDEIDVKTRYETERLKYILENIVVKNKTILDVGGNTGFFSFELIESGALKVHYYEGNKAHADFVRLASDLLEVNKNIEITNHYLSFENELENKKYDIILLLNVLHHVGDDYGDTGLSIKKTKEIIIQQLNTLSDKTDYLVFQMGFNWKGNPNLCLFKNGTKKEMIDFISDGIKDVWEIISIGIPEKVGNRIEYNTLTFNNIERVDELGEFLNRPLFILKSKRLNKIR